MPSTTYALVRQAILDKQNIEGDYNGFRRVMSPHTIGRNTSGAEQALFYQFAGGSKSGLSPAGSPQNWRCIPLAGLANVKVVGGEFHTAPNHSRPQTCVAQVDVEVAH
jgi:hypothetical protein